MKHIDRSNIVDISANTENANFPIENVLDLKPGRKYKTPTGEWVSEIAADCTIGVSDIVVAGTNATQATVSVDDPNVFEFAGDWEWGGGSTSSYPAIDAIVESSADIVDVFIYDTRNDSDGGAWVDSATTQSWYTETLNTATRGATRAFPKVALIVAQTTKVTIYDMTRADVPMWMVFIRGSGRMLNGTLPVTSVFMLNGILSAGTYGRALSTARFISDVGVLYYSNITYLYDKPIVNRNDLNAWVTVYDTDYIINGYINDVAMTVIDSAPIDAETGIAVPTIAVATDAGVSVIDGPAGVVTVVDITCSNATYGLSKKVNFNGEQLLFEFVTSSNINGVVYAFDQVPSADNVITLNTKTGSTVNADAFYDSRNPAHANSDLPILSNLANGLNISALENGAVSTSAGLTLLAEDTNTPANGMAAYITDTYNTGWMQGDIKLATLMDSTAETITSADTVADRSVNANDLSVVGTLTKSAVATGAELMAYSGFSTADYLEQPYNADLDFGTGDFYVMGWIERGANSSAYYIERAKPGTATGVMFIRSDASNDQVSVYIGGTTISISDGLPRNALTFLSVVRRSGVVEVYSNGVFKDSTTAAADLTIADAILRIGCRAYIDTTPALLSSISMVRIGSGAPSADQIAKIYNDEKELFAENAQCLLPSASVTALSYDKGRDRLTVGTDSGLASFCGLARYDATDNTFDTTQTVSSSVVAVSSYASRHAIATDAQSYAIAPSIPIIDQDEWGNVPLTVTGTATQDFINKCLWIELSESVNVPCELSIKLFGPSGEPLEVGVIQAGISQTYGNRNPRYGLQKTQNDYSISHQLSNGNTYYKLRNIARVFSASAIMTRANTRLMEQFFKRWGQQPTGWRLTDEDSNDFVVFGRVSGVSITDSYPNHSDISWTITEVL